MDKFGRTPVRSLNTFGVAGLLAEESKVYYSSLFSSKNLGRVSDLISAKLKDAGLNELKLRAILLFSAFEVLQNEFESLEGVVAKTLPEPLIVEYGVDVDKIALGISFVVKSGGFPTETGLADRISSNQPQTPFERLLVAIHQNSDRLVVRLQPSKKRVEIISLLGMVAKIDASELKKLASIEVVVIHTDVLASATPEVSAYVELGDVDYQQLIEESPPAKGKSRASTGDLLKQATAPEEGSDEDRVVRPGASDDDEFERIVKGGKAAASDEETLVHGNKEEEEDPEEQRFSGFARGQSLNRDEIIIEGGNPNANDEDDDEIVIQGGKSVVTHDNEKTIVSGGPSAQIDDDDEVVLPATGIKAATKNFFDRIRGKKKAEKSDEEKAIFEDLKEAEEGDDTSDSDGKSEGQLKKLLSGIRKAVAPEEDLEAEEEVTVIRAKKRPGGKLPPNVKVIETEYSEEQSEERTVVKAQRKAPPESTDEQVIESNFDPEQASGALANEIASTMDQTIRKAKDEGIDIAKKLANPKARKWMEGLVSDLVAEKSRLNDAAKRLTGAIRQKELEFKNREQTLRVEVQRREETIKQKNAALAQAKNQLNQALSVAAGARSETANVPGAPLAPGMTSEDKNLLQKLNITQAQMETSKKENEALHKKIDEMKGEVRNLQSKQGTGSKTGQSEMKDLQVKLDRQSKLSDELKKVNSQLQEKLEGAKKQSASASREESKKSMEQAQKLVQTHLKENQRLSSKMEETQKESLKTQADLNRVTNELRNLKAQIAKEAKRSAGSGGGAANSGGAKPGGGKAA